MYTLYIVYFILYRESRKWTFFEKSFRVGWRFVQNGAKRRKITQVPHLTPPINIPKFFLQIYPVGTPNLGV